MQVTEDLVDDFLFASGLSVQDYFIERTPMSEILSYRNAEGREFDLLIDDESFAAAIYGRLKALNVRVVNL